MKFISLAFLGIIFFASAKAQKDTSFIYFPFDSDQLTTEARQELQGFLEIFQKQPARLTIYGHCDSKGSHTYNDQLSEKRTSAVKKWLEENGVKDENISLVKELERWHFKP